MSVFAGNIHLLSALLLMVDLRESAQQEVKHPPHPVILLRKIMKGDGFTTVILSPVLFFYVQYIRNKALFSAV